MRACMCARACVCVCVCVLQSVGLLTSIPPLSLSLTFHLFMCLLNVKRQYWKKKAFALLAKSTRPESSLAQTLTISKYGVSLSQEVNHALLGFSPSLSTTHWNLITKGYVQYLGVWKLLQVSAWKLLDSSDQTRGGVENVEGCSKEWMKIYKWRLTISTQK